MFDTFVLCETLCTFPFLPKAKYLVIMEYIIKETITHMDACECTSTIKMKKSVCIRFLTLLWGLFLLPCLPTSTLAINCLKTAVRLAFGVGGLQEQVCFSNRTAGGQATRWSDWQTDGRKDFEKPLRLWNLRWRRVKTVQGHIVLLTFKHLSPGGSLSYLCVCVHVCAVSLRRAWDQMRNDTGEERRWAVLLLQHAVWILLYGMWLY